VLWEYETAVELYIDRGKDSEKQNKSIFDKLMAKKTQIEGTFGDSLEWERLDTRRASRIRKTITLGGWKNQEQWPNITEATVDAMVRLEAALRPHIQSLDIESA
jgi:hypothetical protein